jgi:hypothetical protein
VNYFLYRNVTATVVVLLGAIVLVLFPARHLQLVPGLLLLWGELVLALGADRVAHSLTKRAIALKGIQAEQNPGARKMYANSCSTGRLKMYEGTAKKIATVIIAGLSPMNRLRIL